MSTPAATSVESVREKRAIATLWTTSPIFIGIRSLNRSQRRRPVSVLRKRLNPKTAAIEPGKMMNHVALMKFEACRTICVSIGSSPPSCVEDVHEDRDDEEQHPDEDEGREDQHHRRVDHRALDAALDLRLLLDLERDAVEHVVEDSGRLARLDHRDVQAVEDLRVPGQRLREQHAALDVGADLADHGAEVLVVGLLLEDHERADDVQAGLDHRRELAREDLQRLRLDLLERGARRLLAGRRAARRASSRAGRGRAAARAPRRVGRMHLAERLDADGVDRAVRVGRHTSTGIGRGIRPLEVRPVLPMNRK